MRHIKDGFVENTQSKAHLIAGMQQVLNQNSSIENQQSFYFPSYEIMLDELRDYRFYADDMLHPNKLAVDYIWEKFQYVWITSEAEKTMKKVNEVQKTMQHRPFNADSEAHQHFLQQVERKKHQLQNQFPHIIF